MIILILCLQDIFDGAHHKTMQECPFQKIIASHSAQLMTSIASTSNYALLMFLLLLFVIRCIYYRLFFDNISTIKLH